MFVLGIDHCVFEAEFLNYVGIPTELIRRHPAEYAAAHGLSGTKMARTSDLAAQYGYFEPLSPNGFTPGLDARAAIEHALVRVFHWIEHPWRRPP
ncbi:hypothetical protein GGF31_006194 [Allomyces arbusculus]|nr:hypothetical protein GGF31_006194 [Allomyces arbusculus]